MTDRQADAGREHKATYMGGTRTPKSRVIAKHASSSLSRKNFSKREVIEDIVTMEDEAAFVEEGVGPAQSPLVAVSFQRNVHRKEKYLEAEPKALGITQIGLSLFQITCVAVFLSKGLSDELTDVPFFISSLLLTIAGSLAVAAGNLHLPTLRACLAMQIVACGASVVNLGFSMVKMESSPYSCWNFYYEFNSTHSDETCRQIENTHSHFFAEVIVIQTALLAISVTLAVYCCKVVNCCSPAPKIPVITVHAAAVQP